MKIHHCTAVIGRFVFGEQTCGAEAVSRFVIFADGEECEYAYACQDHDFGSDDSIAGYERL